MQEAKYSINIKINFAGYDTQVTMRSDDNLRDLVGQLQTLVHLLPSIGAQPRNGNGRANGQACHDKPTCQECEHNDNMELVKFERGGKPREAWKCQTCDKWHYEKKSN